MSEETLNLATIYRETVSRIDTLSRRVQEGRDVQQASEFCRWLLFSGIIPLLKFHANKELPPLKIDGAFLQWKCEELLQRCNEFHAGITKEANLSAAYLQSLHEKIDLMAGYLGKLSVAPAVVASPGHCQEDHSSSARPGVSLDVRR